MPGFAISGPRHGMVVILLGLIKLDEFNYLNFRAGINTAPSTIGGRRQI